MAYSFACLGEGVGRSSKETNTKIGVWIHWKLGSIWYELLRKSFFSVYHLHHFKKNSIKFSRQPNSFENFILKVPHISSHTSFYYTHQYLIHEIYQFFKNDVYVNKLWNFIILIKLVFQYNCSLINIVKTLVSKVSLDLASPASSLEMLNS